MRIVPTRLAAVLLVVAALPLLGAGAAPAARPRARRRDVLLLLAVWADGAAIRRRFRVDLVRRTKGKLAVGAKNRVTLHLRNRGDEPLSIVVRDAVPPGFAAEPAEVELEARGHGEATATYELVPPRRGRFAFGDLHVRARGPLGLAWVDGAIPAAAEARVYPDLRAASKLLAAAARELLPHGVRRLRRDGQGTEFARLREYVPGDPIRDVDWKATARRLAPVSRVYELERSQPVVLCVDAGRATAARAGALSKLDHAVNAALFLAFVAIRAGDRVGLLVFDDEARTFVAPGRGRAQYRKIVDALFAVEPSRTFTDHRALYRSLTARVRRRSLVAVFTDVLDEEQTRELVGPLRILARRHATLAVCMKDEAVDALVRRPPEAAGDALQQAVAVELLEERERLLVTLGQGGVHVVDVVPSELTAAAVNKYLELKRRAAI